MNIMQHIFFANRLHWVRLRKYFEPSGRLWPFMAIWPRTGLDCVLDPGVRPEDPAALLKVHAACREKWSFPTSATYIPQQSPQSFEIIQNPFVSKNRRCTFSQWADCFADRFSSGTWCCSSKLSLFGWHVTGTKRADVFGSLLPQICHILIRLGGSMCVPWRHLWRMELLKLG